MKASLSVASVGPLCSTTLRPYLYSSLTSPVLARRCQCSHLLDAVTGSGSRFSTFPPLLLTVDDQSLATGWGCLQSTRKIGVDEYLPSGYHLTNMDNRLKKNKRSRSLPSSPRFVRTGFGRTDRTNNFLPDRPTLVFCEGVFN